MRKYIILLLVPILYLLFWPTAVDPKSWQPPLDEGFNGVFAPNTLLQGGEAIALPEGYSGPEAVLVSRQGDVIVSTHEGALLRMPVGKSQFELLVETGGRPLGITETETGDILIADAYRGLLSYSGNRGLEVLVNEVDGEPLGYVNDVAYLDDGWVFFTDSSAKFHAQANGGTYPASLLDIMEHGGHGRLFSMDLRTGVVLEVAHGFNFANGVAAKAGNSEGLVTVFVNETGNYRVLAFDLLDGVVQAQRTVIDNLPGFPDNLSLAPDGDLWLGLVSPRSALLDKLADKPFVRQVVQRLPAFLRPKAQHYGAVVKVSGDGTVVTQMQDPSGAIYTTTGVAETEDRFYISRLHGDFLVALSKRD
ncbi:SMP-30/gluconolactonase/LRE family protein [Simiduia agarivorans]|uniref:Strictosidine synthase family protein n=1 Tax=Simiduia agarivorans (strain DSM 21679 / JCM 13881 / BCRC 17597 / SA1) TaxID=1117647 RepID=K4KUW5_SIMAS|nr:SMP-30/gluconolactonase/LRE family protein [Simiduia agarivorans]AFU97702.1 strictosidine synthase family protein [Simiduia agarivorans SA1 = DSM 21679]